jgi:hypothetical protein
MYFNLLVGIYMALLLLVGVSDANGGEPASPSHSPSSKMQFTPVGENEQAEFLETTFQGRKVIAKVPHDDPDAKKQVLGSE